MRVYVVVCAGKVEGVHKTPKGAVKSIEAKYPIKAIVGKTGKEIEIPDHIKIGDYIRVVSYSTLWYIYPFDVKG